MKSLSHTTSIRVRYAETDNMGYVYHGNYIMFFEVGRNETFRALGLTYKEIEEKGILMPIIDASAKYKKPSFYDDLLTITTEISPDPKARLLICYTIQNEQNEIVCTGETTLAFLEKETKRPIRCPEWIKDLLQK